MVSPVNPISDPFWAHFSAKMRQKPHGFSGIWCPEWQMNQSSYETLSCDEKGHLRFKDALNSSSP